MRRRALEGLRVLDLSGGVAGQFCARLFADNGADVVLVEPSGGSPTRRVGPFARGRSALFWHLNLGKRSVSDAGPLLARADVIVTDAAAPPIEGDVGAVVVDITGFGRDGMLRDWCGGELVYQALSGTMFENGLPGREPLYGVGHRASYAAGTLAYLQALAALRGGGRPRVDVSIAEVAASMNFNRATQYDYNGTIESRDSRTTPRAVVRCADGWAAIFIYDHRWRDSCRALGLEALVEDPRFATERDRLAHWDEFVAALEAELCDRPVDEVLAGGQAEKVVVAKALTPLTLRDDPQLAQRSFWAHAGDGALPRLGPMLGFSATPQEPGIAPPEPCADAVAWEPREQRATPALPKPLAGVRVLDLTTAWSGPMATRILASLGADVLKVEGPGRIDDWRGPVHGGLPERYPDLDPGERPYNRCFQFNAQNHDKRALALDLKTDAGRAIALALAARADVMIANFSAGTLERMGLGWDRLRALNPRLIHVEMPAYGDGGPMGHWVALGPSMEFMCGMASLIGYGDGRPTTTGPAYLDPIGGFNAAAAVVTALAARGDEGVGQHVEVAQREAAMHWIGEEIVAALATGTDRRVDGNRVPDAAPHGAFPCAGEDEWIALAAHSEAHFAALCEEFGLDGELWPTHAARKADEDGLDARVSARTRTRKKHELAAALQARGVPAAPVANARDLRDSPFLAECGLLQAVAHPEAGTHIQQGLPLRIAGWDLSIGDPAPCFGQHTTSVLQGLLGMDDDAIERLREEDVISDQPRGAEVRA